MFSSAIEHAAWNVLGYWTPPEGGASPVRYLKCVKQARLSPDDPRLTSATLALHTGQHDRVSEGQLLGLDGNGNGTPQKPHRVELTPVAKVLKKRGPLPFEALTRAFPGSRATAARRIRAERAAGQIVVRDGVYTLA
jgi:hypothetical protein